MIQMYSDGACKGNPGPGGWGVLLVSGQHRKELFGGEAATTNNRMEITAVIQGLTALKRASEVQLYTDSTYVLKAATEWLPGWRAKGWRGADKKPVKNVDLWQQLEPLLAIHKIHWHWVKGHAGHEGNERADALANLGVEQVLGARASL